MKKGTANWTGDKDPEKAYNDDEIKYFLDQLYSAKLVKRIKETKMIDNLVYASYKAQREIYNVPYSRCSKHFQDADIYEMRYQIEKLNAPKQRHYKGKSDLDLQEV